MTLAYSAEQVRAAEAALIAAGVPLMARAASALAAEVRGLMTGGVGSVLMLVGAGDNGGDALFAGAELARDGSAVTILRTADRVHEAGLAAALSAGVRLLTSTCPKWLSRRPSEAAIVGNYSRSDDTPAGGADDTPTGGADDTPTGDADDTSTGSADASAGTTPESGTQNAVGSVDAARLEAVLARTDVIVDGILGTGASANPALRGRARELVTLVLEQATAAQVVAVDLPSGIDPTTGAVPDPVVLHADVTVTFGGIKAGLLRHPGSDFAGRVVLAQIGIEKELERVEPVLTIA